MKNFDLVGTLLFFVIGSAAVLFAFSALTASMDYIKSSDPRLFVTIPLTLWAFLVGKNACAFLKK